MKVLIERGFSRLPIAQRMMAAETKLKLYTSPSQTPPGATPVKIPSIASDDQVGAIQQVIEEHHIDVFWPQYAARYDLSKLACAVHASAIPKTISLIDDKTKFMEWLGDDIYRPNQVDVLGADGVEEECHAKKGSWAEICVKPVIGVNGNGYWKLVQQNGAKFLDDPEPREIDLSIWLATMRLAEQNSKPRRLLLMEWMPGPEVSIDLLCWHGEPLIHAARTKLDANHQRIEAEHPVIDHSYMISKKLKMHGIVSLQYRLDNQGRWRILEMNPRPAGGSIHSEDAGFGIITHWAKLIAGTIEPSQTLQKNGSETVRFVRNAQII